MARHRQPVEALTECVSLYSFCAEDYDKLIAARLAAYRWAAMRTSRSALEAASKVSRRRRLYDQLRVWSEGADGQVPASWGEVRGDLIGAGITHDLADPEFVLTEALLDIAIRHPSPSVVLTVAEYCRLAEHHLAHIRQAFPPDVFKQAERLQSLQDASSLS